MGWQGALLVACGGAIGSVLRWLAVAVVVERAGPAFPWGTFGVNLLGSLAIGFIAELARVGAYGVTPEARTFLVVGILGGFTTFSSFSLETLGLVQRGAVGAAAAYAVGSVALGLGAAALGFGAARGLVGG